MFLLVKLRLCISQQQQQQTVSASSASPSAADGVPSPPSALRKYDRDVYPLLQPSTASNVDQIRMMLLANNRELLRTSSSCGITALCDAIYLSNDNNQEIGDMLLKDCNISINDSMKSSGMTPLAYAVEKNKQRWIKWCLLHGADARQKVTSSYFAWNNESPLEKYRDRLEQVQREILSEKQRAANEKAQLLARLEPEIQARVLLACDELRKQHQQELSMLRQRLEEKNNSSSIVQQLREELVAKDKQIASMQTQFQRDLGQRQAKLEATQKQMQEEKDRMEQELRKQISLAKDQAEKDQTLLKQQAELERRLADAQSLQSASEQTIKSLQEQLSTARSQLAAATERHASEARKQEEHQGLAGLMEQRFDEMKQLLQSMMTNQLEIERNVRAEAEKHAAETDEHLKRALSKLGNEQQQNLELRQQVEDATTQLKILEELLIVQHSNTSSSGTTAPAQTLLQPLSLALTRLRSNSQHRQHQVHHSNAGVPPSQ